MNIAELQEYLQNVNITITAREIAGIWGMDETSYSRKKKVGTPIKYKNLKQLEEKLGINLTNTTSISTVTVNYYPEAIASCGNGTYTMSENYTKCEMPATFFKNKTMTGNYSMCHARGNSMYPLIWDGDYIICEHQNGMDIKNGDMYIFCYDDQIYLKRLTKDINQIVVESENPDFKTQYIKDEDINRINLIGHVIYSGRII